MQVEKHHNKTVLTSRETGLLTAQSTLRLKLERHHFVKGHLNGKCVASILTMHWQSLDVRIKEESPQIASVVSTKSADNNSTSSAAAAAAGGADHQTENNNNNKNDGGGGSGNTEADNAAAKILHPTNGKFSNHLFKKKIKIMYAFSQLFYFYFQIHRRRTKNHFYSFHYLCHYYRLLSPSHDQFSPFFNQIIIFVFYYN